MKFKSDVDLDFGNRDNALSYLKHHPASIIRNGERTKHNTGVYITDVPTDPYTNACGLDYKDAEERGYVKLDFLNVSLYTQIKDDAHLNALLAKEPDWAKLYDPEFCAKLMHIGSHYDTLIQMPDAVNSVARMAMFIAVIRPAKRHLIGKTWAEIAKTIWDAPTDGGYYFKKSHSVAYAHLVCVNMNLLDETD